MFRVVIPARYGSTRLPGKALLPLAGKPMVQWVYERARESAAREVLIATDDARIAAATRAFGAETVMTAATHASGTDRIAEVARIRAWAAEEIIVNVQGDEPLVPPALIEQVAGLLQLHPGADIATVATRIATLEELLDPNAVKVVAAADGRALYFSRAPVPWDRDGAAHGVASQRNFTHARRHVGLYAYRAAALQRLAGLPPSPLESLEKLEQLRALEHGMDIRVAEAVEPPGPDVNTRDDLARVSARLAAR